MRGSLVLGSLLAVGGMLRRGNCCIEIDAVLTLTFPGRQSGCVLTDGRHRILHPAMSEDARRAGLADSWTVSCGKLRNCEIGSSSHRGNRADELAGSQGPARDPWGSTARGERFSLFSAFCACSSG